MAVEAAKIVINVSAEGTQQAAAGLGKVDEKVGGISDTIKQLVAGGAIIAVTKAFLDFGSKVTKAFGVAETAAVRLDAVAQMRGMDGAADRISKLASEMQTLTGVSDEVVKNLGAELIAQGKSEAMTQKMIKAAADLSAVTGDSLNTSVEKLNRSLSGQAGMLGRTNPEVNKLTKAQLEAGGAIDLIAEKYAGMADSMKDTIEVSGKVRDETVGDLTEAFGQFLAPAVIVVNDAFTAMATGGIAIMEIINQMPGPIRAAVVAVTALGGAVVALALAQATGIAATIKKTVTDAIAIAKTVALTVAKWAQYAAQMAINAAMAVTNPLLWAGIAAAAALTVGTIALVASQNQQAESTKKANSEMSKSVKTFNDLYRAAKAWDAARKGQSARARELNDQDRAYADTLADVSSAKRGIIALERVGILTREESLNQQIEAEKEALEATIARAREVADPTPFVKNAQNQRAAIARMEEEIKRLREVEKVAIEETVEQHDEAEEKRRNQLAQTMEWINSHYDEYGEVIEDNHAGWLEKIEEVKSAYQGVFGYITQGMNAIGTIADNIGKAQIMRIDEEMAKREEAGTLTVEMEKKYEAEKKKIERDAAVRAKAFAVFQAALNIPLMIMEGFKLGNVVGAAIGGAMGTLQLAAAASTPIPSAQFGGEFMVPPGYQGDSGLLRVNSGEKVSVEPVRDSGSGPKSMVVQIGQREFEGYLQEVLNSGRVTIRRPGVVRHA